MWVRIPLGARIATIWYVYAIGIFLPRPGSGLLSHSVKRRKDGMGFNSSGGGYVRICCDIMYKMLASNGLWGFDSSMGRGRDRFRLGTEN